MDFDALMKKKLGGKYNKPSLVESLPQTEDGQDQAKPKNKGQKKATFKPRVTCSQCDFVGIDGKEMDIQLRRVSVCGQIQDWFEAPPNQRAQ